MNRLLPIFVAGALAACSGSAPPPSSPPLPSGWSAGPVVNGVNDSPGVVVGVDGSFDFPQAPPGVHYVTATPPWPGRTAMRVTFGIQGTQFVSVQDGGAASVTLFLQRCGDDWATDGFRFWSKSTLLAAGTYSFKQPLEPALWTGLFGQNEPANFQAALSNLCKVGFTFGNPGAGATGHGAYSVGPAHFTLSDFGLE